MAKKLVVPRILVLDTSSFVWVVGISCSMSIDFGKNVVDLPAKEGSNEFASFSKTTPERSPLFPDRCMLHILQVYNADY